MVRARTYASDANAKTQGGNPKTLRGPGDFARTCLGFRDSEHTLGHEATRGPVISYPNATFNKLRKTEKLKNIIKGQILKGQLKIEIRGTYKIQIGSKT